jgi:uncharacterized protein YndB with AHSA1/START domain/DNA-binding MarR family transcriptional regulator
MDGVAAALGDPARWRIVELLAERPRSVGELAELTGLRQPQTTKHLQTLARAGLVTVTPLAQRRVYAIEPAPLQALQQRLHELVQMSEAHGSDRDVIARYHAALEAETAAAHREGWADGRVFSFERELAAPLELVWRHWVDPELLAGWWAPPSLTVSECALEPRPGGRALLVYRDRDGTYRSEGTVHAATEPEHLSFDMAVLDARGTPSFTGHYDIRLIPHQSGTKLDLDLRVSHSTVEAAPFIAGIPTGWGQVLNQLAAAVERSLQIDQKDEHP